MGTAMRIETERLVLRDYEDGRDERPWCIADNTAAARVLQKVGFKLEGRLRQNERFKGRRWDTLLYGLLRGERAVSAPTPPTLPPTPCRCYSGLFMEGSHSLV